MSGTKQFDPSQATVSVLVPIYNVEKYLSECLDSLLSQTHRQLEIIVIDDGSTDRSGQIADDYSRKDSRIKVIHQENGGVSVARNAGLDAASGDFIAFMDGDDWVDANWIETQLETLKRWNADIAVCGCELVYKNARKREDLTLIRDYIEDYEDKKKLLLTQGEWRGSAYAQGHTQKKIVRKNCLIDKENNKKIRFITDRSYCEDEPFTLHMYKNADRVAFNDKSVFYYRMRASSAVSEAKFVFKWLKSRTLMRETHLISDEDFLLFNTSALWQMKLVNPKNLDKETSELFYKNIAWCQEHIDEFKNVNCSTIRKAFVHFYLSKWLPFPLKHLLLATMRPLKNFVRSNDSALDKFE